MDMDKHVVYMHISSVDQGRINLWVGVDVGVLLDIAGYWDVNCNLHVYQNVYFSPSPCGYGLVGNL